MENLRKFILSIIAVVFAFYFNAFVFQHLWNWFIVDTFSVDELTKIQSFGICFLLLFIQSSKEIRTKEEDLSLSGILVLRAMENFIKCLSFLVLGFLIHYLIN